jgi:hypothetical protein
MIIALFLAHLVGDYILQWDALALAKSRSFKGVLGHCVIVALVTLAFALPFSDSIWWQGVLVISLAHFVIDAGQLWVKPPIAPLTRYMLDQALHFLVIVVALAWGGFLDLFLWIGGVSAVFQDKTILLYLLGYAFVTMPAWVLIKFLSYGLVIGTAPNFPEGSNKYVGIIERLLITTFAVLGQFLLIPVVALPRLALEWPNVAEERTAVYLVELLASMALAVAVGLALGRLSS